MTHQEINRRDKESDVQAVCGFYRPTIKDEDKGVAERGWKIN
jgi:hypothetical protein